MTVGPDCGTDRGYHRHRLDGTHTTAVECGCKAAHNLRMAENAKRKRRAGGIRPPTNAELAARFGPSTPPEKPIIWVRRGAIWVEQRDAE